MEKVSLLCEFFFFNRYSLKFSLTNEHCRFSRFHGESRLRGVASPVASENWHGPDEGRTANFHLRTEVAVGDVRGLLRSPRSVCQVLHARIYVYLTYRAKSL